MRFNVTAALAAFLVLWPTFVFAGQTDGVKDDKKARAEALRENGKALLLDALDEAKALRLPENRLHFEVTIAETLWPLDQEKARAILAESAPQIGMVLAECTADEEQGGNSWGDCLGVYQGILQRIGGRDPKLAFTLSRSLRSTVFPTPNRERDRAIDSFELEFALKAAEGDPDSILPIAKEYLSKGSFQGALGVLARVREKEPKLAGTIGAELVGAIKSADLQKDREAARAALQLLQMATGASATLFDESARTGPTLQLPESARRDLIVRMAQIAATATPDAAGFSPFGEAIGMEFYFALRSVMADVRKYTPSQAAQMQSRMADFDKVISTMEKMEKDYRDVREKSTVDSLVEAANQGKGDESLYQMAIEKAIAEGNPDRARQIALEKIADPATRKAILERLDREALSKALTETKVEEVRRLLAGIRSRDEKISILAQLAKSLVEKKDVDTARAVCAEARQLMSVRPANERQFRAALRLAEALAEIEPDEAFALTEPLVAQLNDLIAAVATLDGFAWQDSTKNDEFRVQRPMNAVAYVSTWAAGQGALARSDFDRVRQNLSRLVRPELRVQAKIAVAAALIESAEPEKPSADPVKKTAAR